MPGIGLVELKAMLDEQRTQQKTDIEAAMLHFARETEQLTDKRNRDRHERFSADVKGEIKTFAETTKLEFTSAVDNLAKQNDAAQLKLQEQISRIQTDQQAHHETSISRLQDEINANKEASTTSLAGTAQAIRGDMADFTDSMRADFRKLTDSLERRAESNHEGTSRLQNTLTDIQTNHTNLSNDVAALRAQLNGFSAPPGGGTEVHYSDEALARLGERIAASTTTTLQQFQTAERVHRDRLEAGLAEVRLQQTQAQKLHTDRAFLQDQSIAQIRTEVASNATAIRDARNADQEDRQTLQATLDELRAANATSQATDTRLREQLDRVQEQLDTLRDNPQPAPASVPHPLNLMDIDLEPFLEPDSADHPFSRFIQRVQATLVQTVSDGLSQQAATDAANAAAAHAAVAAATAAANDAAAAATAAAAAAAAAAVANEGPDAEMAAPADAEEAQDEQEVEEVIDEAAAQDLAKLHRFPQNKSPERNVIKVSILHWNSFLPCADRLTVFRLMSAGSLHNFSCRCKTLKVITSE